MNPISVHSFTPEAAEEYYAACSGPAIFDGGLPQQHRADRHLVADQHGRCVAHCSLWWNETPPAGGDRPGVIGHYMAKNDAAAHSLLTRVCVVLRDQGCTVAMGPMDGSIWRAYRLITHEGAGLIPVFPMEETTSPDYPRQWRRAGFAELTPGYRSSVIDLPVASDQRLVNVTGLLKRKGVRVRPLNMKRLEQDLKRLHPVAVAAFGKMPFYVPPAEADFMERYLRAQGMLTPELCLVAERDRQPVGFVIAIFSPAVENMHALVTIRSLAVLPERELTGLGAWLVDHTYKTAVQMGAKQAVHAMVPDKSLAANIHAEAMTVFRRYHLFGRALL